ncbi:5-formyltetrahydrofolate cyclo-ligase [Streptomyces violaceoruber]|uniref:5-formyltetrahydrofolate cyclo-ligase n=1 Tax=Streptomyces violaceoruber TaxID=1935 RepID=A0ACD4WRA0_STRVN|nr:MULTISPECIES: 5-formyltetrahydrofolate cyclo-ligase [Streptomyces]BDD72741.1 5-formyltetrahydrofolate cyclo-ligase [Streptomyces coelicolor]MDX3321276.1 5-formyltetrahydrofolate cyclo-ligase [Streptomyces sp. ME03-5684b]MDX3346085.1 5-formyltetrahydrofolate cyclo-ligase [Streptomyces sp. ME02-6979A]MDX3369398.1 5-formyltetrahydrofolate cyclo-ligase [Streptomyces sp. ME02-6987-2C]MDX3424346.1 5-formyltetrahydrofolate cyclo-ligase [Streptomyces sp. ME02-6985-2c]
MPHNDPADGPGKRLLRRDLLAARNRMTPDDVRESADALARRALGLPEVAGAHAVAAYVSVGAEPGTLALLDALRARGVRVLLPALLPDNDLDWGEYTGEGSLARVRHGGRMELFEPAGERLGPEAVTRADVVLLPGVAVDGRGLRLGRGGGSYDRVLARLEAAGARPALLVLLYDGEVVEHVPAEPHDRPVDAVVTPSGVRRFR